MGIVSATSNNFGSRFVIRIQDVPYDRIANPFFPSDRKFRPKLIIFMQNVEKAKYNWVNW